VSAAHPDIRQEEDDLGPVEVPSDALWGARTQRFFDSVDLGGRRLRDEPHFVVALARVKRAAAQANSRAGVIDPGHAAAIDTAAAEIEDGRHNDAFVVDLTSGGGGTPVNVNVNEVVANLANERLGGRRGVYAPIDPKRHVNASQSSADVCHTAVRLAVLDAHERLASAMGMFATALDAKATEFADVMTLGRTCLRDAVPTTVGAFFAGHAAAAHRAGGRVAAAVADLHAVNLGGTVIGAGDGAPPAYRAQVLPALCLLTGRQLSHRESLHDAAQNIDDLAAASAAVTAAADMLARVAADVRLLSSGPAGGFGELVLPAVAEGSTFFPGKVNPVVPETAIQAALSVRASDVAVRDAAESGELNLNVYDLYAGVQLLGAIRTLAAALEVFVAGCLDGIAVDAARCTELAGFAHPIVQRRPS
jgi:aspartate ammonia-lyase